jgi:hypothetical protein
VHFNDVIICENPRCGAILRMSLEPGPIAVAIQTDVCGTFIVCPRCDRRTLIHASGDADAGLPPRVAPPAL